jgi:hypothetical protein
MNTKVQNYSAETVEKMVFDYKAGVAVEQIAQEIGKSVRSVVAKLSREGVYVAKKSAAKADGKVTKADLIAKIAAKFEVEAEVLASLEKATKEALEVLAA